MADRWLGVSYYAGMAPEFPVDKAEKQLPLKLKRPAIALVWDSFGDKMALINDLAARYPEVLIEIHISNECSRRSGRSEEGRPIMWRLNNKQYENALVTKTARRFIRNRLDDIKRRLAPFHLDNVRLLLSSGLEISITNPRALYNLHQIMHTWIKAQDDVLFNTAQIVYSPMGAPTGYFDADLIEAHSSGCQPPHPNADIWNMDGCALDVPGDPHFFKNMDAARVKQIYEKTSPKVFFSWSPDQQGLRGVDDWNHGMRYSGRKYIFTDAARKEIRQLLLNLQGAK